ncbi:hypothetical protein [Kitasatospora sp. NBC_01266]|uniref:hypothetical protein n=1 Tax=Kitasatospora sp. NBC_01266 TaxID=2903572 RepID=UPI002E37EBE9|nr:hypothetical protein [Kitasatospora sp. NBC_01266]
MTTAQTPAQLAYTAYGTATGGLTHDDRPMPAWEHLGEPIQAAWTAAAAAVLAQASKTVLASRIPQPIDDEEYTNQALESIARDLRKLAGLS